jgi:hypothetical protein
MTDIFHEIEEEKEYHRRASQLRTLECIHCDFSITTNKHHPSFFEYWICEPRLKEWIRKLVEEKK